MNYGLNDIRLNGEPMTLEQMEHYTESESKRNTELLITLEDGSVEDMTLGEFIDSIEKEGPIEMTPASYDDNIPSGPMDPFALPENGRLNQAR